MSVRLTMVDVMRPVLTIMVATHVSVTVTYNCYLISGLVDVRDMKLKSVNNFSWYAFCLQYHPRIVLPVAMAAGIHVMREITRVAMWATHSIGMECCVEVRARFYET